jgi:hypothetical protein
MISREWEKIWCAGSLKKRRYAILDHIRLYEIYLQNGTMNVTRFFYLESTGICDIVYS